MPTVLDLFSPPVARWFRETYGAPTPAQAMGWPHIAAGEHTLIHAPTGSGKTLAAFLFAINERVTTRATAENGRGVHTMYVSPLRALAADVRRNLETPLVGIRACADAMGISLREVSVGLRTGDTPASERQRMVRRPPDLLVTTPESLHLLLTSPRAREGLRSVRYVIVDEIHTLCGEKRGAFLSLLLERLEALAGRPLVRIGLSATQRPLERVAEYLGGFADSGIPRPVTIVDAGARKDLDLEVVCPVANLRELSADRPTIWPAIVERLVEWTSQHASTLVFANNRRAVERLAAEMNKLSGINAVRAHHGSVSKESRQEIERDLKAGRIPALVATSSLELGIDMGAIDLVCQVESPNSVASALQRVGRAGHVYRATSKGRLVPKTRGDLLRMAGMTRAMLRGDISEVRIPQNPLDVLAQQIVAMVAVDDWLPDDLYGCVRRAGPFHTLPRASFDGVVDLACGAYRTPAFPTLRARLVADPVTGCLTALPGARYVALLSGGTIPETGQYAMVLEDGTSLGELDEEFVFERRLGDTFILGTGRWRIRAIRHDRVVVAPSTADEAQLPFWKGDGLGHDASFGRAWGEFLRECGRRHGEAGFEAWLAAECALDANAARNVAAYLAEQKQVAPLPDDRTLLIDAFPGEARDGRVAVLSTYGRAFHLALWMALRAELRRRDHPNVDGFVSNDGILIRLGALSPEEVAAAVRSLADGGIEERVTKEIASTPAFALRFRQNAARALLLPRARPGGRIPLWLQRLRAAELLIYASGQPRFPILVETYREILRDALPLDALSVFFADVARGEARVELRRGTAPSPFASALAFEFVGGFLYESDRPAPRGAEPDRDLAAELVGKPRTNAPLVEPAVVETMDDRLQGLAPFTRARDGAEILDLLHRIGDLTRAEIEARCEPAALEAIEPLIADRRLVSVPWETGGAPRWTAADDRTLNDLAEDDGWRARIGRFVEAGAGRTRDEILTRYPGTEVAIDGLVGDEIVLADLPGRPRALVHRDVLLAMRRMTLAAARRRVQAAPRGALFGVIAERQRVGVAAPIGSSERLEDILGRLAGWLVSPAVWLDVLAARASSGGTKGLDALVRSGVIEWRAGRRGAARVVGFALAGDGRLVLPQSEGEVGGLAGRVLARLASGGALFLADIARGLGEPLAAVEMALNELLWASRVTNDAFAAAMGEGTASSRRGASLGRWSVTAPGGADVPRDELLERIVRLLLDRYGILTREFLEREPFAVRWGEVYPLLARMEWRGEVDRGYFVADLSGPQFALPGFAAQLQRGVRLDGVRLLHSLDPANLFGDIIPVGGSGLRRGPGSYVVTYGERAALAIEGRGRRLSPLNELEPSLRRECLAVLCRLVERPGQPAALRVEMWDGRAVVESAVAADLADLGFLRDDREMVLYRSYGRPA